MQDIYLSPHYDDIAFSLSSIIKSGNIIIDIFTNSNYIENKKCGQSASSVSKIRENEEKLFVLQNKLNFITLGFNEN